MPFSFRDFTTSLDGEKNAFNFSKFFFSYINFWNSSNCLPGILEFGIVSELDG